MYFVCYIFANLKGVGAQLCEILTSAFRLKYTEGNAMMRVNLISGKMLNYHFITNL